MIPRSAAGDDGRQRRARVTVLLAVVASSAVGAPQGATMSLWTVAGTVLLINLPFGFWRAGVPKFGWRWFVAVHAPVPLIVALRIFSGLGFELATVPLLVAAFFAGQFLGGRFRLWWRGGDLSHHG